MLVSERLGTVSSSAHDILHNHYILLFCVIHMTIVNLLIQGVKCL